MKNHFYSNRIAGKIRSLLNENLSNECAKNISIGDLSILPGPDNISEYLPAAIININEIEVKPANVEKGIYYTPYYFTIYYIYPYTFETGNYAAVLGKGYAQSLANVLINHKTLEDFTIEKSENEAGGLVINTSLSSIRFENEEMKFFRKIDIPAHVATMEFFVGFRSFAQSR